MAKQLPDAAVLAADFAHFWSIFPNHTARAYAEKCYTRARKFADHDVIMKGLDLNMIVWANRGTVKPYLPHASTWLNQRRWENEYSPEELQPRQPKETKNRKGDQPHIAHALADVQAEFDRKIAARAAE